MDDAPSVTRTSHSGGVSVLQRVMRLLVVLPAAVATLLVLCWSGTPAAHAVRPAAERSPAASGALRVLHRWDDARAAAWVSEDPAALRRLYMPGSSAAAADVRRLGDYAARGTRVVALRTQVFSVRVRARGPRRLRLDIVDRAIGSGVDRTRCVALPVRRPRLRTVDFWRRHGRWLVASVS